MSDDLRELEQRRFEADMNTLRKWWPWVRFQKPLYGSLDRRWFWTPLTYRFGHGGWVFLSLAWLWRFRKGVR